MSFCQTQNREMNGSGLYNAAEMIVVIDREIDTVLAQFGIEKKWIRKLKHDIPGTDLVRIEKRVMIPNDVLVVLINRGLNIVARRYGGRAIGSENLRENSTAIHIKLGKFIIETIIFKSSPV